jgi:hypothetical protein
MPEPLARWYLGIPRFVKPAVLFKNATQDSSELRRMPLESNSWQAAFRNQMVPA